ALIPPPATSGWFHSAGLPARPANRRRPRDRRPWKETGCARDTTSRRQERPPLRPRPAPRFSRSPLARSFQHLGMVRNDGKKIPACHDLVFLPREDSINKIPDPLRARAPQRGEIDRSEIPDDESPADSVGEPIPRLDRFDRAMSNDQPHVDRRA